MKKRMLFAAKLFFCCFFLFLSTVAVQAQTRTITGKVTGSNNEPLAGVTISVRNSSVATTSGADGAFSISVPGSGAVLEFSMVGYATQTATAASGPVNITLLPSAKDMDEVVVIGYGTVKKSDVTGSVVSLKADELTPGANINVQQLMQGRAAGVQVYQKSGEPGSAMSVKIRGASSITAGNDPLYVIDGMPVNDAAPVSGNGNGFVNNPNPRNPLNSLNPSDIESIEILKDASATAIYGSRGANGVVLITTKKGTSGKLRIGYNGYYGVQNVANSLDMLNGEQYRDVLNAIIDDGGGNPQERVADDVVSTDWQGQLYRQAPVQSHDLSFSGGMNNSKYYVSLGYFDQQGVLLNSGVKRYTARMNLENSVAKEYAFGINLTTSYIRDNYNSVGLGVNENSSALYSAIYYDPTVEVMNADGGFNRSIYMTMDNPVALINGQYANSDAYRTFGNIYGEYFLHPTLSAKVKVGGDINSSQRNVWVDPITISGEQNGGLGTILTGTRSYYMAEATLNYNNEFKNSTLNAVAGATYERFGSYSFSGNGRGFTLPDLTYNAIGSGNTLLNQIGSGRAETKINSFLARANYVLHDKYLLTGSIRADGSSRFGPDNRYGFFPSGAIAWKMHQESFLRNTAFISELKLRASYGAIGNQSIANFLYIPTFSNSANAVFGNVRYPSIAPSRNPNPGLKWEAAVQADIGVDFAFFNSRIKGSLEYYNRKTTDLLLNVPQPLSSGFLQQTQNIGSMKNSGVELAVSGDIIGSGSFNWNLAGNISTLKNEVLDLGPSPYIITGGAGFISDASIIRPGDALGSYYGYEVLGVWQTRDDFSTAPVGVQPGDTKYRDLDGNNTITDADRMVIGKAFPDFTYGITNTLSYGDLEFSMYIEGAKGGSILNSALVDSYFPVSFRRNKVAEPYLNRWTPDNPTNEYPSFVNPVSQGQRIINTKTVEDATYVRLQSARLAYRIPVKTKSISNLSVYVSGQNLITITNYTGTDPAINAIGDDILKIDYSSYPFARTFMMGVNVQF